MMRRFCLLLPVCCLAWPHAGVAQNTCLDDLDVPAHKVELEVVDPALKTYKVECLGTSDPASTLDDVKPGHAIEFTNSLGMTVEIKCNPGELDNLPGTFVPPLFWSLKVLDGQTAIVYVQYSNPTHVTYEYSLTGWSEDTSGPTIKIKDP